MKEVGVLSSPETVEREIEDWRGSMEGRYI